MAIPISDKFNNFIVKFLDIKKDDLPFTAADLFVCVEWLILSAAISTTGVYTISKGLMMVDIGKVMSIVFGFLVSGIGFILGIFTITKLVCKYMSCLPKNLNKVHLAINIAIALVIMTMLLQMFLVILKTGIK